MPPKASRPPHPWPLLPGGITIVGATWDPTPMGSIQQFMPKTRRLSNLESFRAQMGARAKDYDKWHGSTETLKSSNTKSKQASARRNQSPGLSPSNPSDEIRVTDEVMAAMVEEQAHIQEMQATEATASPTTNDPAPEHDTANLLSAFIPSFHTLDAGDKMKLRRAYQRGLHFAQRFPHDFKNFVDKYRDSVLSPLDDARFHGGKIYRRTEEGMLAANGSWLGNFHHLVQLRVPCGDELVELVLALVFEATRLNPEKKKIPQGLADGEDMSYLRPLLWDGPEHSAEDSEVIYFFSPHTPPDDLQEKIKVKGYRCVLTDPRELEGYGGMTENSPFREGSHRNQIGVNARVRAAREVVPVEAWYYHPVYRLADPSSPMKGPWPVLLRHWLEHWMLVIFKLTEEALGGLNVNLVDDWSAECLLSSKDAKLTLRFIDTLLGLMADDPEKSTRLRFLGPGVPDVTFDIALPPTSDQSAWNTLLAPKFPSGFPVTMRFFRTVMNGSSRVHLLKGLNLENIKRCFSKTRHHSFGQAASTELLELHYRSAFARSPYHPSNALNTVLQHAEDAWASLGVTSTPS
ncbi:uncharacterized protein EHS24_005774 [Apiotrichum porosum]|uniref:Uncharacterized protein n=1 Tax=Apiotrichum porosum TaxID=105984 RepID=A0A427XZK4_9TREE|nr:uncharacterized protein EHS24_005774 [Apiotrichum porosum]RSH84261.1 hypothetical protein EHS24_005774 [Apiotrichum porosum]